MSCTNCDELSVVWGATLEFTVTVTDRTTAAAVAINTATNIWCTVKKRLSDLDAAAVHQVTKTGGGITVEGASNNVARVKINDFAAAEANSDRAYEYDVKVQLADGFEDVVARGVVKLARAVTLT